LSLKDIVDRRVCFENFNPIREVSIIREFYGFPVEKRLFRKLTNERLTVIREIS